MDAGPGALAEPTNERKPLRVNSAESSWRLDETSLLGHRNLASIARDAARRALELEPLLRRARLIEHIVDNLARERESVRASGGE